MCWDIMVNKFRNGIFSLRTRRLGTVAEIMIKKMYGFSEPTSKYHDMKDNNTGERIEVKFSTASKKNTIKIRENNVVNQCLEANELSNRVIASSEVTSEKFDCNIQQIKPAEFDILFYGLFFYDCIQIYKISSDKVRSIKRWSDKQHKNNSGEGQFHITNDTYAHHQEYFIKQLSYSELYDILK